MLIWPFQIAWTFFTLQWQTMSVISVLFIAVFFYYTVTGGWGITEVRQSYTNVTGGTGTNHESQRALKNLKTEVKEREEEERRECGA